MNEFFKNSNKDKARGERRHAQEREREEDHSSGTGDRTTTEQRCWWPHHHRETTLVTSPPPSSGDRSLERLGKTDVRERDSHRISASGGFQQKIKPKRWLRARFFLKGGLSQNCVFKRWFLTNFPEKICWKVFPYNLLRWLTDRSSIFFFSFFVNLVLVVVQ